MTYSVKAQVLNDGREYFFIALDGQIPSSPTRYKTRNGALRAVRSRQLVQRARG